MVARHHRIAQHQIVVRAAPDAHARAARLEDEFGLARAVRLREVRGTVQLRAWLEEHGATLLTVTLALVFAAGAFVSRVGPIAAQQGAAFDVSVVDFAFEPGTVTVPAGATVTWTNTGSRPHTVSADDGSFDSGRLDPGEQFSQTFDQPGTFAYHCGFHPEMQGSIVVTEQQAAESATTPEPQQVNESNEATPASFAPSELAAPAAAPPIAYTAAL